MHLISKVINRENDIYNVLSLSDVKVFIEIKGDCEINFVLKEKMHPHAKVVSKISVL